MGIESPRMGIGGGNLIDALFSKTQQRVLAIFFGHPSARYQLSQVIALAKSGRGAVQRELEKLTRVGILQLSVIDGRKLYEANRQSPIFDDLRGLILKTVGLLEPLTKCLQPLSSKIDVAFVYGSVAKGEDTAKSDIDLMVIARELAYAEIYSALGKAEKKLHRSVSPNIMSPGEWKQKLSQKNSFVSRILQQPKLFIFGSDDELQRIG
jgi:predicted nucleotidyltransferase